MNLVCFLPYSHSFSPWLPMLGCALTEIGRKPRICGKSLAKSIRELNVHRLFNSDTQGDWSWSGNHVLSATWFSSCLVGALHPTRLTFLAWLLDTDNPSNRSKFKSIRNCVRSSPTVLCIPSSIWVWAVKGLSVDQFLNNFSVCSYTAITNIKYFVYIEDCFLNLETSKHWISFACTTVRCVFQR